MADGRGSEFRSTLSGVTGNLKAVAAERWQDAPAAPAGYVAIQRSDLYQAALDGRTWQMLGSRSAGEYVSGFYPDVDVTTLGTSQSTIADASSRRRPNPLLSGRSLQKRSAARPAGMDVLEMAVRADPTNEEAKLELQMEKARVPSSVRKHLQRNRTEQKETQSAMEQESGQDLYSSMPKSWTSRVGSVIASKAMSVMSAMEERPRGPRKLIVESVIVENLPGDVFGRCKPFLIMNAGITELKTRALKEAAPIMQASLSLETIGFEPGLPCHKAAVWDQPMEFQFEKGVDLVLTVRVMEAERFGWDEETGIARFAVHAFSHGLKEQVQGLLKDSKPVKSHDGSQDAHVRILARVPADVDDGPVGIGVCFIQEGGDVIVDSLASNYKRGDGGVHGNQPGVDPKPGDKVLAIDGVNVQSAGFARIVSLTMGPLGSTCSLHLERSDLEADSRKVVECVVERCALDVPEPDFSKADALTDEEQLALMIPVQVRSGRVGGQRWARILHSAYIVSKVFRHILTLHEGHSTVVHATSMLCKGKQRVGSGTAKRFLQCPEKDESWKPAGASDRFTTTPHSACRKTENTCQCGTSARASMGPRKCPWSCRS